MITLLMILVFVLGYTLIAFEFKTQINKTAISLFLGVSLWILYVLGASDFVPQMLPNIFQDFLNERPDLASASLNEQIRTFVTGFVLTNHLGDVASILFFLMGAMTIVEVIDQHGGFNFVNRKLNTRNSCKLLWMMMFMTFFMSSVLDNLTTAIVMIMVLRKLVSNQEQRWLYAAIVVVAANAGGAFSPIGDVTTILLWINGNVTTTGIIKVSFIPALISAIVPTLIISRLLKCEVEAPKPSPEEREYIVPISHKERILIFCLGLGGLMFTPIFKSITGLPPFMGVMAALAVLWTYTELIYKKNHVLEESLKQRVNDLIKHIDMSTVLFLFGILMSVAALEEAGILHTASVWLDQNIHNTYGVTVLIGFLSAFVDNGSLVAGVMGMYPIATQQVIAASADPVYLSNFVVDGEFWNLLAYCAGTGGSLTIIGSAAGVMVMGLEKMTFAWYFKKFSWMVLIGYLSGVLIYYLQSLFGLI